MKPTHYFKSKETNQGTCQTNVKHWVTPEMIQNMISFMLIYDYEVNRKSVEKQIREHLFTGGKNWFDYGVTDDISHNGFDRWDETNELANKYFPDFMKIK